MHVSACVFACEEGNKSAYIGLCHLPCEARAKAKANRLKVCSKLKCRDRAEASQMTCVCVCGCACVCGACVWGECTFFALFTLKSFARKQPG